MGLNRRLTVAALAIALSVAGHATAQTAVANLAAIRIDNFGQVDANYYRGAQPEPEDFKDLAALGIRTVIDLTRNGEEAEATWVKNAGMQFYRIPMTTTDVPAPEAVAQFLKLVNDPANQPVYVHCQGGKHRTGAMTAIYRITTDGWNADQAYGEMKKYHFETLIGHPQLKRFVYDFYTAKVQGSTSK